MADSADDIEVIYTNASGTPTTLSPSLYTLVITPPAAGQLWGLGGSVTYPLSGSPIATGTSLTIQRILPLTQIISIGNQGDFAPEVIEEMGDTLEMQIQQLAARTGQMRGTWVTGRNYSFGDVVQDGANGLNSGNYYMCSAANTSGTWATDLAAGDWSLVIQSTLPAASLPLSIANGGTGSATAALARTALGLGTAAVQNTGTSGTNVPLLSTANVFGAAQTITQTANVGETIENTTPAGSSYINYRVNGASVGLIGADPTYPLKVLNATGGANLLLMDTSGNVTPQTDNAQTDGSSTNRWSKNFSKNFMGTTTNDDAAVGAIGEFYENDVLTGSAVSLANNTTSNIASLALSAGDWDVWGNVAYNIGTTTVATNFIVGITSTSATLDTIPSKGGESSFRASLTGLSPILFAGYRRYKNAGTTTVYLATFCSFTISTLAGYGYLAARRAR